MSLPEVIIWLVVAGIGLPAAFRNWTALALCWSWLVAEVVCRKTGINLPTTLYFVLDCFVLLVIFIKPEIRDCSPYRNFWEQMKALCFEHSLSDVIVAGIFPLMWVVYVVDVGDFYRWWTLWGLVQLQFFAAGWEAFNLWRQVRKKVSDKPPPDVLMRGVIHGF